MKWNLKIGIGSAFLAAMPYLCHAQQFGVGASQPALTFRPGILSTLVGNGTSGTSGDGGPAASALVTNGIRAIAADASGDVYFVDDSAYTVRVVYEGGATSAALIKAENPAVTAPVVGDIYVIAGKEGTSGTPANGSLATSVTLKPGAGLCIDAAGDVFFNDSGTNKVWAIYAGGTNTAATNLIALEAGVTAPVLGDLYAVAGNSAASAYTGDGSLATATGVAFHGVNDMKFDTAGDMYIVDQGNNAVRVVNAKTGVLSTFAGGNGGAGTAGSSGVNGPATAALLNTPYGIAVDASNDVYIADKSNKEIKVVYEGGAQVASLITLENTTITSPTAGDIYIIAGGGKTIYPYNSLGTSSALNAPTMVALDAAGNIYIADNGYYLVAVVNLSTGIMSLVAGNGTTGYAGDGGAGPSGELAGIRCVAVDAAGRVYITDATNYRIREVSQGILTFVGEPVGSTSAPATITLTNTGSAVLDFTGGTPVFSGTDASEFALDPSSSLNTCNLSPLQPDSSCALAITYTPNHSGTSNAVLTYMTNGVLMSQPITLVGLLTPTTTALAASTLVAYPGQSVILTATVSPSVLTGSADTVTFLQGTNVLATMQLPASGSVTYTVGPLALGAYTYTAKFSGDTSFSASTSNSVTVDVSTFAVTASSTSLSVIPGQAASTTITITGSGPASQILSLSCTAPAILGCAFSPPNATVASGGTTTVTVSIAAVATTSSVRISTSVYEAAGLPLLALLLLGIRRRRLSASVLAAFGVLCALSMVLGCSENNIGTALQPSTQTVTINVTGQGATPLVQSIPVTVNVQ